MIDPGWAEALGTLGVFVLACIGAAIGHGSLRQKIEDGVEKQRCTEKRVDSLDAKVSDQSAMIAGVDKQIAVLSANVDGQGKATDLQLTSINHDVKNLVTSMQGVTKAVIEGLAKV